MKRKILIFMFLLYIGILSFLFLYILVPGVAIEENKSISAIENATVDAYNPDVNYGGSSELEVGYWMSQSNFGGSQPTEFSEWTTYIKFDLSEAPVNFHKAELKLECIYIETNILLGIYETSSEWNEFAINWNNAPLPGVWVSFNYMVKKIVYTIDVVNAIEDEMGNWSIYLSSDDTNWLSFASKNCYSGYNPPEVLFYYFKISYMPTIIVSVVIIILMIVIIIAIRYNKYRKRDNKKKIKKLFF